jgi:hypothetical protein
MQGIFCYRCGGFMSYRKRLSYRLPSAATPRVPPHSGVCSCTVPVLDRPPPGFASIRAMPSDKGRLESDGLSRPQFVKNFKL